MATVSAAAAGGVRAIGVAGTDARPAAVQLAMEAHFRSTVAEPGADYSPTWRDAKLAMRLLNHMSPLLLGIIQRPGSDADLPRRMEALQFMLGSTDALARVMSEHLSLTPVAKEYDRIELNSMLTHIIGRIWEQSTEEDQQARVDDFLRTVAGVFSDKGFLQSQSSCARRMMEKVGYLRVDNPETMETRLRVSMHQVSMRFYEAICDSRLGNSKGVHFTFGLKKKDLLQAMLLNFDQVVQSTVVGHGLPDALSNDQRASVLQSWIRQASEVYRAEYVARTHRLITWFREGMKVSQAEYKSRFDSVSGMAPAVLDQVAKVTNETMADLLAVTGFASPSDQPQEPEQSPSYQRQA